jgi:endonuclease/exonuclease/phosphatase (EEP) superfamily protein YafD
VTVIVGLVGIATLLGLLDRYVWVLELADVFRLQYLVVLVAAMVAALGLRRPRLAAVAGGLAVLNAAVVGISFAPPASAAAGPASGNLRLLIANLEVGNTRFDAVERLVSSSGADVVGVTELTPAMAAHLTRALPAYDARLVAPRGDAYGVGVFSRVPLLSARVEHYPAGGPPTIVARVRVAGKPVTVVVTHVHTPFAGSIHVRHLRALAAARPGLGKRLAVCGDFNTPPWTAPFRRLEREAGLASLYGPSAWTAYSWPTWSPALRVPIDNCLVSGGLVVRSHDDGPSIGSDHFPLVVDLAIRRSA